METETKKEFDAVAIMRDIRNKIDRELQSMTSEERKEYYAKQKQEFETWKKARRVTNVRKP